MMGIGLVWDNNVHLPIRGGLSLIFRGIPIKTISTQQIGMHRKRKLSKIAALGVSCAIRN